MSVELLDDLDQLDLLRLSRVPAPAALLVDSSEEPRQTRLLSHLEEIGVRVRYEHIPGPKIWIQDPYKTVLPSRIVQIIVSWVSQEMQ